MVATTTGKPMQVVFYSHDSQGLGHFRRNRALARALSDRVPELTGREVTGLLVNGVDGADGMSTPQGFDVVTLPAIGKGTAGYGPRHLGIGMADLTSLRGEIVRATFRRFTPDLVVVDRHALGVGRELEAGLTHLRQHAPGAHVVLGLREVLDQPEAVQAEWAATPATLVRELFDEIWVYGDPHVHDLRTTGELPGELADLVTFQGYLAKGRVEDPLGIEPERPYIVTTVGGGSDGLALCAAAAVAEVPEGYRHVLLTGPQMPEADYQAVVEAASPRTRVVRSVPDAAGLIRDASASVSMAGYNTVCETMATDVPALFVPREKPRQEQLIRARGLAALGMAEMLRADDLTPGALTSWWTAAVERRVDRGALDLAGLEAVGRRGAELAAGQAVSPVAGPHSSRQTVSPVAPVPAPAAVLTAREESIDVAV
ncbi:glycosyltransferase family protein [Ornithinimicrobium panacihumi]|uniref:glycosyltransferase family protein n=1 Tax=Ornithinimicrobium panacihumi TaxID=2008449 RepID=UPI003F89D43E